MVTLCVQILVQSSSRPRGSYLGDGHDIAGVGWQVVFTLPANLLERGHGGDREVRVPQGLQDQRQHAAEHDWVVCQPFCQRSWVGDRRGKNMMLCSAVHVQGGGRQIPTQT